MLTSAQSQPSPQRKPKDATSVWIRSDTRRPHLFNCFDCKYPLFKYQGRVLMIVPGAITEKPDDSDFTNMVMSFPFIIECRGHSSRWGLCSMVYYVEQFVEVAQA